MGKHLVVHGVAAFLLFEYAVKAVERIVAEVGVATVLAGSVKVMATEWRKQTAKRQLASSSRKPGASGKAENLRLA
jgi:ABC-type tungstate transport system substrate-binding protein